MKTIIVATDFSTAALNAAEYAADMALAIQANILLLHISLCYVHLFGYGGKTVFLLIAQLKYLLHLHIRDLRVCMAVSSSRNCLFHIQLLLCMHHFFYALHDVTVDKRLLLTDKAWRLYRKSVIRLLGKLFKSSIRNKC